MTNFNWQTESEDWDAPEPQSAAQRPRRRLMPWLFGLLLVLVASGFLYRQVRQQLDETAARVRDDVLSTHAIVQDTAVSGDRDLFITFLSGRDPGWTNAQQELLAEDLLFNYPMLGLRRLPDPPRGEPDVTIAPDFNAAEVVAEQPYQVTAAGNLTRTVYLEQTAVYRRGPNRWLLAPPEDDFWGRRVTSTNNGLTLIFPERDGDLVRRMGADIGRALDRLCTDAAVVICVGDRQLRLYFDKEPSILLDAADLADHLQSGDDIRLPTPSLVGWPAAAHDAEYDAAYESLLHGYLRLIAGPFLAERLGDVCCQRPLVFQALVEKELSRLGLAPWPLVPADYRAYASGLPSLGMLTGIWRRDPANLNEDARRHIYTVVDFTLASAPEATPVDLFRQLRADDDLSDWMEAFLPDGDRERLWHTFLFERLTAVLPPPPIPLPDQNMIITCTPMPGQQQRLIYNPTQHRWSPGPSDTFFDMLPLPGGRLLLVENLRGRFGTRRVLLWEEGQTTVLLPTLEPAQFVDMIGHDGSRLLYGSYDYNAEDGRPDLAYLDIDACQAGDCQPTRVSGWPTWSPDGRHTLLMVFDPGFESVTLFLGDAAGESIRQIDAGGLPVWLDDETFAYLRIADPGRTPFELQLIVSRLEGDEVTELATLTASDVQATVEAAGYVNGDIQLGSVVSNRGRPEQFLLSTHYSNRGRMHTILYDWTTGELELLQLAGPDGQDETVGVNGEFSADGRWLALRLAANRANDNFWLTTINLDTGQERSYGLTNDQPFDDLLPSEGGSLWSADSQWLLRTDDSLVYLIAPEYDYQRPLLPPLTNCSAADWLRP